MERAIVLEQHHDYVPTQLDVEEYAEWLGMDLEEDAEYFWIAEACVRSKLPEDWVACQTGPDGDVFFFNTRTGQSIWEHPCDEFHRQMFEREKEKNTPVFAATLYASELSSGAAEVSVMSMGGDEVLSVKVVSPQETVRRLVCRIEKELFRKVRCVLPDGYLLSESDDDTLLSKLFDVIIIGAHDLGDCESDVWENSDYSVLPSRRSQPDVLDVAA